MFDAKPFPSYAELLDFLVSRLTVPAASAPDGASSPKDILRKALSEAQNLLANELHLPLRECRKRLIARNGGTAKSRARRLGQHLKDGTLCGAALADLVLTRRHRDHARGYAYAGGHYTSAKELYGHLKSLAGPAHKSKLSYRQFCLRLDALAQTATDAGPIQVGTAATETLLTPRSRAEIRQAVRQAIRAIDQHGAVHDYPDGRCLYHAASSLISLPRNQMVSTRQFTRNLSALRSARLPAAQTTTPLHLTAADLTALCSRTDPRLSAEALEARIAEYEHRHSVTLNIPRAAAQALTRNLRSKLPWHCPIHGDYTKALDKANQGCPSCGAEAGIQSRRLEYAILREYVEQVVGYALVTGPEDYVNTRTPLTMRDRFGILHSRTYDSLRRNPFLTSRSASETIMRLVLQAATGEVFSERSPAWLRPLRYDAYNAMLRINFEYDGYQHTGKVERWHRGEPNALASIRADDREKDRLSIQNGVRNIRVPYWMFPFADPTLDAKSRRSIEPEKLVGSLYDFLADLELGITLQPREKVIDTLAAQLIAMVNAHDPARQRLIDLCTARGARFISFDLGARTVRYYCTLCRRDHQQQVSNFSGGAIARECEHAKLARRLIRLSEPHQ